MCTIQEHDNRDKKYSSFKDQIIIFAMSYIIAKQYYIFVVRTKKGLINTSMMRACAVIHIIYTHSIKCNKNPK